MPKYTVDSWEDNFRPIANHLDIKASWQTDGDGTGILFETYGAELDFVLSQPTARVWTYADTDTGTAIFAGYHIANRIGYFVTEVDRASDEDSLVIPVTVDDAPQYLP
jgi:hypothetical protein